MKLESGPSGQRQAEGCGHPALEQPQGDPQEDWPSAGHPPPPRQSSCQAGPGACAVPRVCLEAGLKAAQWLAWGRAVLAATCSQNHHEKEMDTGFGNTVCVAVCARSHALSPSHAHACTLTCSRAHTHTCTVRRTHMLTHMHAHTHTRMHTAHRHMYSHVAQLEGVTWSKCIPPFHLITCPSL